MSPGYMVSICAVVNGEIIEKGADDRINIHKNRVIKPVRGCHRISVAAFFRDIMKRG